MSLRAGKAHGLAKKTYSSYFSLDNKKEYKAKEKSNLASQSRLITVVNRAQGCIRITGSIISSHSKCRGGTSVSGFSEGRPWERKWEQKDKSLAGTPT